MNRFCNLANKRLFQRVCSWAAVVLLGALATAGGCSSDDSTPERPKSLSRLSNQVQSESVENYATAMDYLKRLDEFEPQQAASQIAYHLNRWVEERRPRVEWQPDPMVQRLPSDWRRLSQSLNEMDREKFKPSDLDHLKQALWATQIGSWVTQQSVDPELQEWIETRQPALDPRQREQLIQAFQLFDWTARNIQLDPLLNYPKPPPAVPGSEGQRQNPPAAIGMAGPGYTYFVWQVMLYGHGDAIQRGRLWINLLQQQGIPAVMLAIESDRTYPRIVPWLPAALIGDQLFLFDTQLALPVPLEDDRGIATLEQVVAQPELLTRLGVGSEHPYRIKQSDLNNVVALIDATPAQMSRRMRLLEDRLTGEDRLRLTVNPSRLATEVRATKHVNRVLLSPIPFETEAFRRAISALIQQNEAAMFEFRRTEGVFQSLNDLVQARYKYFRGDFESDGDQQGAKLHFMRCREPDARIAAIGTDRDVDRYFGLLRVEGESDDQWKGRLVMEKMLLRQVKSHASYWLGVVQLEAGNAEAAADWFSDRTLDAAPDSIWLSGARYNLGRAYERLGRIDDARKLYLTDESAQQHGNLLRARLLKTSVPEE